MYIGCNNAFLASLGLTSKAEVLGKSDFNFSVKIEEAMCYQRDDQEVMRSGKPKLNIFEEQTFPSGKKRHLITSKMPLSFNQNGIEGVLGIYTDITELKTMRPKLAIEAVKSKKASEAESEFIAQMSHDLRTPISGVMGMTQDLLNKAQQIKYIMAAGYESGFRREINEFIETVHEDSQLLMGSVTGLLHLCNDILELSRLQMAPKKPTAVTFELRSLFYECKALFEPTAQHKKLRFDLLMGAGLPTYVSASRHYLERILINLLGNALKFTEAGSVQVEVALLGEKGAVKVGAAVQLQLIVRDTGLGIAQDHIEKIFNHFYQVSASYESAREGAGLGLHTVKRYLDDIKGSIDLTSQLGQGSCFAAMIPVVVADVDDRAHEFAAKRSMKQYQLPSHVPDVLVTRLNKKAKQPSRFSVVIVEDTSLVAYALSLSLKSFGGHGEVATQGELALEMLQERRYDMVFMDIGLPDISGIEVTKRIRALPTFYAKHIPVIGLTGHGDHPVFKKEARQAGMNEVLIKPAPPAVLTEILSQYLGLPHKVAQT